MDSFRSHQDILKSVDAKKIVKNYNKTAKVLIEYEMLYHQAWLNQVSTFQTWVIIFPGTLLGVKKRRG